jgi:hypothetical protein
MLRKAAGDDASGADKLSLIVLEMYVWVHTRSGHHQQQRAAAAPRHRQQAVWAVCQSHMQVAVLHGMLSVLTRRFTCMARELRGAGPRALSRPSGCVNTAS